MIHSFHSHPISSIKLQFRPRQKERRNKDKKGKVRLPSKDGSPFLSEISIRFSSLSSERDLHLPDLTRVKRGEDGLGRDGDK
jgi:hypothetical protein